MMYGVSTCAGLSLCTKLVNLGDVLEADWSLKNEESVDVLHQWTL